VPAGTWTHVVAAATDRRIAFFVDGEPDATSEIADGPQPDRQDFRIAGPFRDGAHYAGMLDEIQLFRKALRAEQVRALHAAGRRGVCYR
jgi:hypothetical protein